MKLNENTIKTLKEYFKANEIGSVAFVLEAISEGDYKSLDVFDDGNKDKTALVLYKNMELRQLIQRTGEKKLYTLSWLGVQLLKSITECEGCKEEPKKEEDLANWVGEWVALWKDNRGQYLKWDGRTLGCSEKDAFTRLNTFILNYSYLFKEHSAKDLILGATKNYLAELKKINYAYAKNAENFIYKQEGRTKDTTKSTLAAEIENYIAGKRETNKKQAFSKSIE